MNNQQYNQSMHFTDRPSLFAAMHLHYGDLTDSTCLVKIISQVRPTEIYNLGAQSHVKVGGKTSLIHQIVIKKGIKFMTAYFFSLHGDKTTVVHGNAVKPVLSSHTREAQKVAA